MVKRLLIDQWLYAGGQSRLREIFMKTSNLIKGKYMAEITKELLQLLEETKYQSAEYRVSIYGRSREEWSQLAKWFIENKIASDNARCLSLGCAAYQNGNSSFPPVFPLQMVDSDSPSF